MSDALAASNEAIQSPDGKLPKRSKKSKERSTRSKTSAEVGAASKGEAVSSNVEDEAANRKAIEALCSEPANYTCADCKLSGTRWAVVNFGVFVCIRCSGIHRSLGTHISRVKSTNMDKWSRQDIAMIELMGNDRAGRLLEINVPKEYSGPRTADDVITRFIKKKYSELAFAAPTARAVLKKLPLRAKASVAAKSGSVEVAQPVTVRTDPLAMYGDSNVGLKKKKKKLSGFFGPCTCTSLNVTERQECVWRAFGFAEPEAEGAVDEKAANVEAAPEATPTVAAAVAADDVVDEDAAL